MAPDAALGSGVPYLPAAFAVPGTYVVSDVLGYRRGGIDPATGRAAIRLPHAAGGSFDQWLRRIPNFDILCHDRRLHPTCRRHAVLYRWV